MADEIRADEISKIIRQQIENFDAGVTVAEVGTVIRTRTPEEFAASFKPDFEIAGRLIRGAGVEPE